MKNFRIGEKSKLPPHKVRWLPAQNSTHGRTSSARIFPKESLNLAE